MAWKRKLPMGNATVDIVPGTLLRFFEEHISFVETWHTTFEKYVVGPYGHICMKLKAPPLIRAFNNPRRWWKVVTDTDSRADIRKYMLGEFEDTDGCN